jgi:hypothetical protein
MSERAPHAYSPVGAAGIARTTEAGRADERRRLLAQAKFYRDKKDLMRACGCERDAEALQ